MAPELGAVAKEPAGAAGIPKIDRASPSPASRSSPGPDAVDTLNTLNTTIRTNPLKRPRDDNSTPSDTPAPKSARASLRTTPSITSPQLNGHRKDEDATQANSKAGATSTAPDTYPLERDAVAMGRPNDAPAAAPSASIESTAKTTPTITIPRASTAGGTTPTSPQSATSGGANSGIAGATVTESPTPMDVDPPKSDEGEHSQPQNEKTTPSSLSYPGPLHTSGSMPAPPSRGMSYPMPSSGQTSPTSSAAKKHKCPYCDTVFTRHHNLKSHLLTHSQEKPYVCQQCDMRFRRLHDLKRHGKLHTGEKPHICPKCERKFARGDALARHSKGAGGCAGRRSSMGSFAEDDAGNTSMGEGDDSPMAGVTYSNDSNMTEEERRRTLPAIKAQHVAGQSNHSRTYPPAGGPQRAATTGGLFPPSSSSATTSPSMPNSTGSGHTPNTSISSMPMSAGSGSMYSQGMTESPKPLSPAIPNQPGLDGPLGRQRSPSMTQQFQQQQHGRRLSGRRTPPNLSLPAGRPNKLPALANIAPHDARYGGGRASRSASGRQGVENAPAFTSAEMANVWQYVQRLEDYVQRLEERVAETEKRDKANQTLINTLGNEVAELKRQRDGVSKPPAAPAAPAGMPTSAPPSTIPSESAVISRSY